MKNVTTAQVSWLAANAPLGLYRQDLLSITLFNGQTLRAVIGGAADLTWNGNNYYAIANGVWERGPLSSEAMTELQSSDFELDVIAADTVMFPGTSVPLSESFLTGAWDAAPVTVETVYMPAGGWGNVQVAMALFSGNVSSVQPAGRSKAKLTCQDWLYLANLQIPLRTIQPNCYWTLFDSGCTLAASNYAQANTSASGSSNVSIVPAAAWPTTDGHGNNPQTAPYFAQGKLAWTSGNNKGYTSHIASQVSGATGALTLQAPPPFPVVTGDAFTAYPGCDKTQATCIGKFNNLVHFSGFPYVPPPESAA